MASHSWLLPEEPTERGEPGMEADAHIAAAWISLVALSFSMSTVLIHGAATEFSASSCPNTATFMHDIVAPSNTPGTPVSCVAASARRSSSLIFFFRPLIMESRRCRLSFNSLI